jgi:hypothetical protein
MVSRPWAFETVVMTILLEQQKQIEQVRTLLDALQSHSHA